MIYLDYAATTPVAPEVLETYVKVTREYFANASSLHPAGLKSAALFQAAKAKCLAALGTTEHELLFTASATEAINIALLGYLQQFSGGKIITTGQEHAAVRNALNHVADKFELYRLATLPDGNIDLAELERELSADTVLVAMMWVNNVTGSVLPVKEVARLVRRHPKAKLFIDAAQGITKLTADFSWNDIDMFAFTAHKFYGPKGIGALYYRKTLTLAPVLYGSGVQNGYRPGTYCVALAAAFSKALGSGLADVERHRAHVRKLWEQLSSFVRNTPGLTENSPAERQSYYIYNFSVDRQRANTTVNRLGAAGFAISAGSACSSRSEQGNPVIFAMFNDEERARAAVRVSLSHLTTPAEIAALIAELKPS